MLPFFVPLVAPGLGVFLVVHTLPTAVHLFWRSLVSGKPAKSSLKCGAVACRYLYFDIGGGNEVWRLTNHAKYPDKPDRTDKLTSGNFEVPTQNKDRMGSMIEGYVKAPGSGKFRFFTSSDDGSEVWVAERPDTQQGLKKAVELKGCCREVAGTIRVQWTAGQTYYIRALVKEGGGGEYLRVGLQRDGGPKRIPIPISMFAKSGQSACAARTHGDLARFDLGKAFSRSDAIQFCKQRGSRLAYHEEIGKPGKINVNGGKAFSGDVWTPTLDGNPDKDNEGVGWVQVGDPNRLGRSHKQAHGGDPNWGGKVERSFKGPWVWCACSGRCLRVCHLRLEFSRLCLSTDSRSH